MQISMNAQDLIDGMNAASRALGARAAKPILDGVLLNCSDDEMIMTCSDGSITIEASLRCDVQESGQICIPAKLFGELTRKLPGGLVSLKTQGSSVQVNCMSSRTSISLMAAEDYPEMNTLTDYVTIEVPQNQLRKMINGVVFSIGTDETRQILTGALLEVTADSARMVALDGFRLAMQSVKGTFTLPEGKDKVKAVIPGRVLNELSKTLLDEETPCVMKLGRNRMEAEFANVKFYAVLLAGEYINYQQLLPPAFKTEVLVERIQLADAIDRASLMAREGKNNLVRMSFRDDTLVIASNAEMGNVHEELGVQIMGDPIDIAFNAKYMTDVLRAAGNDKLKMKLNSNVSPCVITGEKGDEYLYLILPVRVFQ